MVSNSCERQVGKFRYCEHSLCRSFRKCARYCGVGNAFPSTLLRRTMIGHVSVQLSMIFAMARLLLNWELDFVSKFHLHKLKAARGSKTVFEEHRIELTKMTPDDSAPRFPFFHARLPSMANCCQSREWPRHRCWLAAPTNFRKSSL